MFIENNKQIIGNASENGQSVTRAKTVGYLNDRYRLGHLWVSEMMLDVQSVLYSNNVFLFETKIYYWCTRLFLLLRNTTGTL